MKSLSIEVKKEVIEKVEITFPSYYKRNEIFFGAISEDNIYRVYNSDTFNAMQNGNALVMSSDLREMLKGEEIDETEFMEAYNLYRKSTDLKPTLVYISTGNGIETHKTVAPYND